MASLDGYIERGLTPVVTEAMHHARAVAILGPRQAGKSTLAQAVASGALAADYITLDDAPVREAALADPDGFITMRGRRTIIDEIQRVPELLLAIKARLDRHHEPGQFLLTGSTNLRRLPTIADALPGRVDYLTLWPFTQDELSGRPTSLIDALLAGEVPELSDTPGGRDLYVPRLLAGGLPEAVRRSDGSRNRFISSYVGSLLDRDLPDTARVNDPEAVARLLRLIAARSGSLARYDALGRESGIDGKTAKRHVETLERLFLVRIRRAWHTNVGKREVKAPKLYVTDTGLLAGLLGANQQRLARDPHLAGATFETFVTAELERQSTWSPNPATFWHYRDGDREVDVVAELPSGEVVGFEVKAGATIRREDFRGLAHLRDSIGDRFHSGVALYTGERALSFGDRLWALPLSALWAPGAPR